jgi:hypothetical protein
MSIDVALKIAVTDDDPVPSGEKTPIYAALKQAEVDPLWPQDDGTYDIRGLLEQFFYENRVLAEINKPDLGHILIPEYGRGSIDDLKLNGGTWSSSAEIDDQTHAAIGSVEKELFDSPQWLVFQRSFDSLGLYEVIRSVQEDKDGPAWISKISIDEVLKSIKGDSWESSLIDYLTAYKDLITFADQSCSQFTRFVARFPFSASIWNLEVQARFVGLLLSPFHPVRLAWLTSVLNTFRMSTLPRSVNELLMSVVSGWQFPVSSITPMGGGTTMAQPIDDGEGALFVGWSLLVPVSNEAPHVVTVPQSSLGERLPATSSSGLTSSAAEEAVEKFFGLNPFVSTVVVDLAATRPVSRLESVDSGIIRALRDWRKRRKAVGLSDGGIRVFDSVNRIGSTPQQAATLGGFEGGTGGAFSWTRYAQPAGVQTAQLQPNIRIVEDSGMSYITLDRGQALGAVSPSFLRRFDVAEWDARVRAVRLSPGIALSDSGRPSLEQSFLAALQMSESRSVNLDSDGDRFEVRAVPNGPLLARADWMIAGDAGIPPAALSEMLRAGTAAGGQMALWEWNAPMFGAVHKRIATQVGQRPYVVVAETNPLFLERLRNLVQLLLPSASALQVDEIVNRMLRRLGSRGIGVSALYADNTLGSPQTGAIGFWLTYELLDVIQQDEWVVLQIPLDKVRTLFDKVGKARRESESGQRADIALLAVAPGRLRLLAVEVKCTGIKSPHNDFADPLTASPDSMLGRGMNQAEVERERFEGFVAKIIGTSANHGRANAALLRTALLSLIDIGIRLSSGPSTDVDIRQRLAGCLAEMSDLTTALDVKVLEPIVLSFEHHKSERKVQYQQTLGAKKISVFQADPATLATELQSTPGQVVQDFKVMIANLLNSDVGVPPTVPPPQPEPPTPPVLEPLPQPAPVVSPNTPAYAAEGSAMPSISPQTLSNREIESEDNAPMQASSEIAISAQLSSEALQSETSNTDAVLPTPHVAAAGAPGATVLSGEDRGIVFQVGQDLASHSPLEYWPSNTAMTNMNVGVFGDPGTGKTQLCLALLYQLHQGSLAAQGHGLTGLVLDPKNDYGRPEKRIFQEAIAARVIEPLHIPIDVIGLRPEMTPVERRQRIQSFVDLLSTVMGRGVGQVQRQLLFEAVDALVQRHNRAPTMVEMRDAYRNARNNRADVVSSLLGDFVNNEVFVSDPSKFVTMSELISKELVIVNLRPLQARPDLLKQVMAILVNQYFDSMLRMPIPGFRRGMDGIDLRQLKSVLLIDEAHLVMRLRFQQLEDILLQGRESGISVILSSQFPDHFTHADMNYAMSLRTWFMHRVPALSPAALRRLGIANNVDTISARILGLGRFESFYSSGLGQPSFIRETPFHELVPDGN